MEHRWGQRHDISRAVYLGTPGGLGARGRISNVSISGAFIVSPLPVSVFSYVQVKFTTKVDSVRKAAWVEGQVVRKSSAGFGIEWCEFAPEAVCALLTVQPFRAAGEPAAPDWESCGPTQGRMSSHKAS